MKPRALPITLALLAVLALPAADALAVTRDELHRQNLSVMVGPSPYGWNFVGVRKDLYIDNQTDLFITAGLGTILVGAGAAVYGTGRNVDSFVVSGVFGVAGVHAGVSYQWKVNPADFIHFGLHVGQYFLQYEGVLPIVAWEHRL
jgi:hypothetical protein